MTRTLSSSPAPAVLSPLTRTRTLGVLAVVLLGQFMAVLDASIVNVAIPSIRTSLGATGSALQLIVSGYVIAYAVLLVTGARLGDRFGQRTMFLAGLIWFTIASLACGLAWNAVVLIVFRFLQGIGAAAMVPQVMTLIQRTFTGPARARALSAYAAVISGGVVAGQIVGGLIVTGDVGGTGWRGVFLVNVPIGLVLLAAAPGVLPATVRTRRRLDLPGLAALTAAVLLLVLPLVLGHEQHWPLWTWLALAGSALAFAGFVLVERGVHRRGGEPLFADAVLRAPGLLATAANLLVVMCTFGGWMFVISLYLQGALHYSALHAGLVGAPMGTVFAIASMTWSRVPARLHPAMIVSGLLLGAATMVILGVRLGDRHGMGVPELVVYAAMGLGFAVSFSPLTTRALSKVPAAAASDASGILVTCVQLGIVIGVASFGSVFLSLAGTTAAAATHAIGVTATAIGVTVLAAAALAVRAVR